MNSKQSKGAVIVAGLMSVAAISFLGIQGAASAKTEKPACVETTRWSSSWMSASNWKAGETRIFDVGSFKCDKAAKVKIEKIDSDTGAYAETQIWIAKSKASPGFSNFKSISDPFLETIGITGSQEFVREPLPVTADQEIDIFLGIQAQEYAYVWGVERHRVRITFLDDYNKNIKTFESFVDAGTTAK
jgi:hypothetical protein